MNYEEFYVSAQALEKGVQDKLAAIQKAFKNATKNSEKGDVKSLAKDIAQITADLAAVTDTTAQLQTLTDDFDTKAYFGSGDFAKQMVSYCEQFAVDVKGEAPTYEIFPYKVRIDTENQDVYINRKKVQCMRPQYFVKELKQSREKYLKASFNAGTFLNELAAAYDTACIVKASKTNSPVTDYDLLLKDLYEYVVPTAKARKEYDLQNYAFDLARLYILDDDALRTKNGRKYFLGTTRISAKQIRILDQDGKEQFLGTIRFFKPESEEQAE